MNNRVLLLACSATKHALSADTAPPVGLYDGPLWRDWRAYARDHPVAAALTTVYALSARHGLVGPTQRIAPYNERLTSREQAIELVTDEARTELARACAGDHPDVFVCGAEFYRDYAAAVMPGDLEYKWSGDNWTGRGGIGLHRQQMKAWLFGDLAE